MIWLLIIRLENSLILIFCTVLNVNVDHVIGCILNIILLEIFIIYHYYHFVIIGAIKSLTFKFKKL